jgi:hypothetical protein
MKQNIIYTPYCYFIGWSKENKFYYGVRYAKKHKCLYECGCHPDEFWVTYFTTSDYVTKMRERCGEPDIIQIRKTFDNPKAAILWENKVLRRIDAIHRSNWLNKRNGIALYHDEDVRSKMSNSLKGLKRSSETIENIRRAQLGKKLSQSHKNNIRERLTGRKQLAQEKEKHKKFIKIYSELEDKYYTYDSWNTLFYETGIEHAKYRQMRKGAWFITRKYKSARWPWQVGDTLTIIPAARHDV